MAVKKKAASRAAKAPARKVSKKARPTFICNVVPSSGTDKDWRLSDAVQSGTLGAPKALPASVDLRATWWKINNQESTGSCVGWASADGVVRYHMTKLGKITQSQLLSPRHLWMASKETDEFTSRPSTFIEEAGTSLKAALDIARKQGCALMDDLPFHVATTMYTGDENAFYAGCANRRIASYFNLGNRTAEWKTWLATKGPIMAALNVDSGWDGATDNGGKVDTFDANSVRGGHAICVVGYRTDGRFIVRNSWGTAWGDKGFAYVKPSYIAAGFFNESYGIVV
jgi:Papain family cysteine protease